MRRRGWESYSDNRLERFVGGVRLFVWRDEERVGRTPWLGQLGVFDRFTSGRSAEECAAKLERRAAAWLRREADKLDPRPRGGA